MPTRSRTRQRVLIVDDFDDAREMYAEYLRFEGFQVAEAKDGGEAVAMNRTMKPDIILMDLAMPRMDGWEATRRIRADKRVAPPPILALTGYAMKGSAERALAMGCKAYIAKPCLPDALVARIRRVLKELSEKADERMHDGIRRGRHSNSTR